jgi:Acyl-CoA dehydrogenase, N-terminal domain
VALLDVARRIADEVLFPAAGSVDRAEAVPALQFELLASAGLYGAAAPAFAGGADLDLPTFGQVVEALAGGSLATAFVWVQHHGLVRALASADAPAGLRTDWLGSLASGACRAGAAYGGLLPGPPRLRATPTRAGGWLLSGESPWVTGWGLVDVLHVAARGPEDTVVWLIVDAVERPGLTAHRQRVVAADAAVTVRLEFAGLPVPASRERAVLPWSPPDLTGPPLRTNGSLPLGVAGRCVSFLSGRAADELGAELVASRGQLDDAITSPYPEAMPRARAAASELAVRAAAALAVHTGSASALVGSDAERLTREALFLLVFGTRPQIRDSLLDRLSGLG